MATIAKDTFTFSNGRLAVRDTAWTEITGSHSIATNVCTVDTASWTLAAAYHETALDGLDQYAKVKLADLDADTYGSIIFRYHGSSDHFYIVQANASAYTFWAHVASIGGAETEIITDATITWAAGDYMAVTVIGAGADTVVRIWKSPTGDAPDAGGTTWGSAAPGLTLTTDPGTNNVDDAGHVYVGFYGVQGDIANSLDYDDFSAGDVAAGGPSSILRQMMQHDGG